MQCIERPQACRPDDFLGTGEDGTRDREKFPMGAIDLQIAQDVCPLHGRDVQRRVPATQCGGELDGGQGRRHDPMAAKQLRAVAAPGSSTYCFRSTLVSK